MEIQDQFFLVFQENYCCPYRMEEHEDNGYVAGYSMKGKPE